MANNQKVEHLLTLELEKDHNFWIHPYTGVLLLFKNDSKVTVYQNFALMNQLPPDQILELPYGKISSISFGLNSFVFCFAGGDIVQVDNRSYNINHFKKNIKKHIKFSSLSPNEDYLLLYTDDDKVISFDILKEKTSKEYKFKNMLVTKFQWLTNSKFVLVTDTGSIQLFDNSNGKLIKQINEAHKSKITTLTNLPRNSYSIVTGDQQGEIKIWDLDENNLHPDLVNFFAEQKDEITCLTSSFTGLY